MVRVEEGSQHLRRGCAYDGMSAWVGGVRGGVADLGKPIGISLPDGVSSSYAVLWNAFKRLAARGGGCRSFRTRQPP